MLQYLAMNRTSHLLLAQLGSLCLAAASIGCGDDGAAPTTCGTGTTLVDGACVADPGPTCGAGTTLENGVCVADGGATCGPGTVLTGDTCVSDPRAPGAVTALTAAVSGASINLSWTAGMGSTGSLVVRLVAGAADAPVAGQTYTVGGTLPGGSQVIAVGAATTFADAFTVPGRYSYMVWSINASGTYGFGREVAAATPLPAQAGVVALNLTNTTATVTTQPARVALAVANLAFITDHAEVELTITNNTAGPLFSPKVIATSLSLGTLGDPSGTTPGGDPYVLVALGALLPGESRSTTLIINGVTATDAVTLDLEVAESGFLITGSNAIAATGGGGILLDLVGVRGPTVEEPQFVDGAFSPSGRYYFGLTRWSTGLFRVDTSNGDVSGITPVSFGSGSGSCVEIAADGFAYVAHKLGAHKNKEGAGFAISRVDLASMTSVATSKLFPPSEERSSRCALRGNRMAVGYGAGAYFFNIGTMAFEDTVPGTTEIDGVALTNYVKTMVFNQDGTVLYAGGGDGNQLIEKVDAAYAVTAHHTTAAQRVWSLTTDAADVLWFGSNDGLYAFNGTTETKVPVVTTEVRTIVEIAGTAAKVVGGGDAYTVNVTTGATSERSGLPDESYMHHNAAWVK